MAKGGSGSGRRAGGGQLAQSREAFNSVSQRARELLRDVQIASDRSQFNSASLLNLRSSSQRRGQSRNVTDAGLRAANELLQSGLIATTALRDTGLGGSLPQVRLTELGRLALG